jgi:hypothetical protein
VKIMEKKDRKKYVKPSLTVYGNVSKITEQHGHTYSDVPIGTPVTGPGDCCGS